MFEVLKFDCTLDNIKQLSTSEVVRSECTSDNFRLRQAPSKVAAGLDKSGVRTAGTTRKQVWATRYLRPVARWATTFLPGLLGSHNGNRSCRSRVSESSTSKQ